MKSLLISLFFAFTLVTLSEKANAQQVNPADTSQYPYWIQMMQDPSINFFDVQRAFNQYWEGRPITKSCGFKPFKRWEYRMYQSGINADGSRRPADLNLKEYQRYMNAHPQARSENGDWVNLGPFELPDGKNYKGLGRLNSIAFDPIDPQIIWVGSPSGGLWKTTQGGNNWTSTTDDLPTLGVSSILIDPTDPDMMYIGTGDRDAGDADGVGVMRSTDGGNTWELWNNGMGNRVVGKMIMHPTNHLYILAATSAGIFRTVDGGQNWLTSFPGNFKDVVFKTDDPNIVYATSSGLFYRSTNMGQNFSMITNGIQSGSRGAIAVTPADPDIVYFIQTNSNNEFQGLFRSEDAGLSFSLRSNSPNIMGWDCAGGSGGQAWYDLDIAADPQDADVIYAGGVNCFKSTNGGSSWFISSHWWGDCSVPAVHADLHVMEYNPLNDRLYTGNDGGIYYTDNGGSSWNLITNGLPIGQVYKIGVSATNPNKVINGYQDNGTSTYMGSYWAFTRGGDGMECAIDTKNDAYSYATVYYGSITRNLNNGYDATVAENGSYGINEDGAWVTPFILDKENPDIMFVGYKNVWRCANVKAPANQLQWIRISQNLSGSDDNMRVLEQSQANPNILFAARYDNRLFLTENALDASPSWQDLSGHLPENAGINDVKCNPFNSDILYMAQNTRIYRSEDLGQTWENISGSLPGTAYTSIAYYNNSNNGLYVSSNLGVYYKDDFMDDWVMFSSGLPVDASVQEIEIYYDPANPANDLIRAGTYGRGMWESDMYHTTPVCDFKASENIIPAGCLVDFTDLSSGIPTAWHWTFEGGNPSSSTLRDPQNIRYSTDGTFPVKLVVTNDAGVDSVLKTDYISVSSSLLPEVGFYADQTILCATGIVNFTDTSSHCPNSWDWSFQPDNVTFINGTNANSQNPTVQFSQVGSYTVTLVVGNENGQSTLVRENYIETGGLALPFSEDFENGSLLDKNWTIDNPDYGTSWSQYKIDATGNNTVRMKFYGYVNTGQRDGLVSPYMNFSAFDEVFLSFDYAYAQRFSVKDSLIVYISDDCGENWTRVWQGGPDGTGVFATSPSTPYEFIPLTDEDWCGNGWGAACVSIDLSQWAGVSGMRIKFEGYNNMGNDLYLDNIMVSNTTGTAENNLAYGNLSLYPNPTKGQVTLRATGLNGDAILEIMNLEGQVMIKQNLKAENSEMLKVIDLSKLSKGMYLIKLASGQGIMMKKIVVK